ncbi:NADP-dependent oxidoreductase [Antrihabitans stalactiti]|uniref:NADP-dependent oxidoreductase n=1 Tax=Antrihabitans stalactiti TaxID=2584121 RepID=A0A848KQN4_9NOCA|nr:NADP-dependent oxidoreductase [Antrihabitans stalactiti]NMN97927.1 NADP-dependent oxidoreductase [Antrihabitans stalactiti]
MRAAIVTQPGGPEAVEILDVPTPVPGPKQVRIKVEAATVNPIDAATRQGYRYEPGAKRGLGWDVAGTVDAVGTDVEEFEVGDAVIGIEDRMLVPLGTQAEYVVLNTDHVAAAPTTVGAVEAATIPLNGLTALQALGLLELSAGQTLLITGAAGAVGSYAIELAAARGIQVTAQASASDEPALRALGATGFVDRNDELPTGFDAVLDTALIGDAAVAATRDGGRFAWLLSQAGPETQRGIDVNLVRVRGDADQSAHLVRLVDEGKLTVRVAETFPLDEVQNAHKRLADGGIRGRLVLLP